MYAMSSSLCRESIVSESMLNASPLSEQILIQPVDSSSPSVLFTVLMRAHSDANG